VGEAQARAQEAPQAGLDALAQAGDEAFEHGGTGQQHFVFEQPGGGALEQRAGPLGAGPAQRIQPARQAVAGRRVGEVAVAEAGLDFACVLDALSAAGVGRKSAAIGDIELPCEDADYGVRHRKAVLEEGAEVAHGAQLQRKAKAMSCAAALLDQAAVGIVEVEIARQVVGRRWSRVATKAGELFVGEEIDRHEVSPLRRPKRPSHGLALRSQRSSTSRVGRHLSGATHQSPILLCHLIGRPSRVDPSDADGDTTVIGRRARSIATPVPPA
jgi:hypothetical protein